MGPIAPIQTETRVNQLSNIATFPVNSPGSTGSLDEAMFSAMSELLSKDAQNKKEKAALLDSGDIHDPKVALKLEKLDHDTKLEVGFVTNVLAKIKNTFEKVVLNSQ